MVEVVTFDEENMFDDYSFALCKTIPEVIEVMGEGFFYKGDNGVLYLSNNYVVDTVTFMVGLKDVTHIEFVEMSVNSNVTRSQIINSMKKKYNYAESSNGVHHFLTGSFIDRAPVSITYDENRSVVYYSYLYAREPWLEYWKLCGMSREEVQEEMSQMGNTFVISDYSYSANGSDYYYITGSEYAYMVGFVFNAYNQVCEYWVYLNEGITKNQINNTLKLKFDFSSAESTGDSFVYYGAGQRFRIVYAPDIVTLNDKFQAPFTPAAQQAWPDVANGLGMTHNQIVKEFGTPYLLMDEYISYFSNNEYINFYTFYFDSKTDYEFVNYVGITLRENANTAKIVEYLSSQYTPFPNGTLEDGSQYAWINSDSSIEIIYYVSMSSIMYMKLN